MTHTKLRRLSVLAVFWLCVSLSSARSAEDTDFFEKKIRPVLVEHCYSCHAQDAKRIRAGLVVDSRDGLLKGGESGPAIVPGHPEKSLLIRALRQDEDLIMPPSRKLPDAVIADFVRWVETGAPDPRQAGKHTPRKEFRITDEDRRHWSFQPLAGNAPPKVRNTAWCKSDIDCFVLARLREKDIEPSPPGDHHTLLRRLSFDLTGLPPSAEEIEAFQRAALRDPQAAIEEAVERLLASSEFGVRWGRHWLDGVRYASDVDKKGIYRDWVVSAFNSDLPYDQFVRMQLAGDLIPAQETDPTKRHPSGAAIDGIKATGMLALATWEKVGRDLAVAEIVDSQIDVVGRHLIGLTLACARCHDHKYDPIATQDYYALAGVFFSSHISPGKLIADGRLSGDVIEIPLLNEVDAATNRRIDEQIAPLEKEIAALTKKIPGAVKLHDVRAKLAELAADKKIKAADKKKMEAQLKSEEAKLLKDRAANDWSEDPPELAAIKEMRAKVEALEKTKIVPPAAIGIQDGGVPGSNREKIGDAPVFIRGDFRKFGPTVPRRFPIILAGETQAPVGERTKGSGRLELANWIASPDHPLTVRVAVNRIWMHLFGEGLVRTPDNFGLIGERPTHPELLDHLARRFIDSGWSVKEIIREIVLSSAYQQTSFADPSLVKMDPENRLLARMSRKRIEYEAVRDSILFATGQLDWKPDASARNAPRLRRTLYEAVARTRIDQTRMMFDGPDPLTIMPSRATTTTTIQALFLMNSPFMTEAAQRLAGLLKKEASTDEGRIARAYLRLLGRTPSSDEVRIGAAYIARSSWENYLQVLMCTNEFVYVD